MKSKVVPKVDKPFTSVSQLKKIYQPQKGKAITKKKEDALSIQIKRQHTLSQFAKLTFGKRIISKYLILEIFSYSSGFSYKKAFRQISQISFSWRLFISLNRELGKSMLAQIQNLVRVTNVAQFLNVENKQESSFIIRGVPACVIKQASESTVLNIINYDFGISNYDTFDKLQTLVNAKNINLRKIVLQDIIMDLTFIKEWLPIIKTGFPILETLELSIKISQYQPQSSQIGIQPQHKCILTIPKLKIIIEEGSILNKNGNSPCLEIILTYIKPISNLVIVCNNSNIIEMLQASPKSPY
ncbi:hypothetical protein FGO68_gene3216 [Halteria grandinella]|uniref:Uncharacterized protein n=1 Tax=Halteria grandinella TaxID=5974 RepID=A0A8J8NVE2_HALGN|nr:hypothetical protein FGO68_gene3216 [Halteria grandinella]